MRKLASIFLALVVLSVLSFGCTAIDKQTKIKCPKCGAVFTVDEGLAEYSKSAR